MRRLAFLIGGDYESFDYLAPGVREDIADWKQYLSSPYGGHWSSCEILDLSGLSKREIKSGLQLGCKADFSIVCFSGHGYLKKDQFDFSETMVLINDDEEMSESSPRTMMIIDCCRETQDDGVAPLQNEACNLSYQYDTKSLYEHELLKCEKGLVRVFAAAEGESAADARSFSRTLMKVARSVVKESRNGILRINEAVRLAADRMPMQQNPIYQGGRRLHHFPFAINPLSPFIGNQHELV